jgi:hypothetical protein
MGRHGSASPLGIVNKQLLYYDVVDEPDCTGPLAGSIDKVGDEPRIAERDLARTHKESHRTRGNIIDMDHHGAGRRGRRLGRWSLPRVAIGWETRHGG